jgi:hypothetical protein
MKKHYAPSSYMDIENELDKIKHELNSMRQRLEIISDAYKKQQNPTVGILARYLAMHSNLFSVIDRDNKEYAKEIINILKCKHDGAMFQLMGLDYKICEYCKAEIPSDNSGGCLE